MGLCCQRVSGAGGMALVCVVCMVGYLIVIWSKKRLIPKDHSRRTRSTSKRYIGWDIRLLKHLVHFYWY